MVVEEIVGLKVNKLSVSVIYGPGRGGARAVSIFNVGQWSELNGFLLSTARLYKR